jgi:hypothetical protein
MSFGGQVPVVLTGLLSVPVPGVWRRLSLISADGTLKGLEDAQLIGGLDELGIPRHQHGIVRVMQSWRRACVPPDVALALWLLREQCDGSGCLYRNADIQIEESSSAIRYIQLAATLGETLDSDSTLRVLVEWLLDRQLPDGSIPLVISSGQGEVGQTARTLRALHALNEPSLAKHLTRMTEFLQTAAFPQTVGVAWSYSNVERTAVTGATSLATLALIEQGVRDEVVEGGLHYLLDAQSNNGGWAEIPGFRTTIHNTFNAVRTLRTANAAGVLGSEDTNLAIDSSRRWFLNITRHRTRLPTLELSFLLRLAVQLRLLQAESTRVERLALELTRRRRQTLSTSADLYGETEIMAIALLECSRQLDRLPDGSQNWAWRWKLQAVPPPFLCPEAYFYELMYGVLDARWWVKTVDALARVSFVERVAGVLLGTIAALGIANEELTAAFAITDFDTRGVLGIAVVVVLVMAWLGVRAAARLAASGTAWVSVAALVVALAITWIVSPPSQAFPGLLSVVALRWLIIDVVAFTADRSGLLKRLVPK